MVLCLMEAEKPKKRGGAHQNIVARARMWDQSMENAHRRQSWEAF